MRILFTRFPLESALGGAEIQTLSLMEGLLKRRHAVAFLGSCPVLLAECRKRGIPCAALDIGPPPVTKWGSISFAWRKRSMLQKLELGLAQFSALDAVCMLSLSEKILVTEKIAVGEVESGKWKVERKGTKVLWIEHDRIGRWLTKNPWLGDLKRASECATTVCVSELSGRMYIELGWDPQNIITIPNGIDLTRFGSLSSEGRSPKSTSRPLHLGCVARLSSEKGVDVLLQAIADVPEVELTIVGKGREEHFLRKLIAQIAIKEGQTHPRIRLLQAVEDLGTFYRSVDALVLPSREHDPFGLVAAEAMSVGTPVIVTDACGIAGYLTDGKDALVVPANDPDAMRAAIKEMMDPSRREALRFAGQRCAREKFSVETMVERYVRAISA